MAAQFVLDEIANSLELGVDQNELTQHMVMRAQQSGQDPQEFANHMFEHNHVPELVAEIRARQGAGPDRRGRDRHRRVRPGRRPEEPAPRRHPGRPGRGRADESTTADATADAPAEAEPATEPGTEDDSTES